MALPHKQMHIPPHYAGSHVPATYTGPYAARIVDCSTKNSFQTSKRTCIGNDRPAGPPPKAPGLQSRCCPSTRDPWCTWHQPCRDVSAQKKVRTGKGGGFTGNHCVLYTGVVARYDSLGPLLGHSISEKISAGHYSQRIRRQLAEKQIAGGRVEPKKCDKKRQCEKQCSNATCAMCFFE